jgi:dTDP-4-dehydrorhamnose 3,5-epimerase-like enzyme
MNSEVQLIKGNLFVDDRGTLSFVNDFHFEGVKRFYVVENHQIGYIRAWHAHRKEGKYVYVVSGAALIGVAPLEEIDGGYRLGEPKKFILSAQTPAILWIPPNNGNGFKSLSEDTKIIFMSTTTLEESKNDDIRFGYNSLNIWEENYR